MKKTYRILGIFVFEKIVHSRKGTSYCEEFNLVVFADCPSSAKFNFGFYVFVHVTLKYTYACAHLYSGIQCI